MALSTYSELQTEALDWMTRADQTGKAPTWIALAEARLNRELPAVEMDATITGTIGSRSIDLTSLSLVEPIALFLAKEGEDETEIQIQPDGAFAYRTSNGEPKMAGLDGTSLDFDCPLDQAYSFRLRYKQRYALSDAAPTNWLLTNHPDIYLAATLMWGAGYNEDWSNGQVWKSTLDEGISSVRRQIGKTKRGTLRMDNALRRVGRPTYQQLINGEF